MTRSEIYYDDMGSWQGSYAYRKDTLIMRRFDIAYALATFVHQYNCNHHIINSINHKLRTLWRFKPGAGFGYSREYLEESDEYENALMWYDLFVEKLAPLLP